MGSAVSLIGGGALAGSVASNVASNFFTGRRLEAIEKKQREEIDRMNKELRRDKYRAQFERDQLEQQIEEAREIAEKQKNEIKAARQAMLEKDWGPRPDYIKETDFAVGLTGRTGVGKTSLWNAFVSLLFAGLLSTQQQALHKAHVPFGKVGALETTREIQPYRFPGTSIIMTDIPGHSTVSFETQNYVRDFSIGYYDVIFYVYSDRLYKSDVDLLLNFIMYGSDFRLVRQKFRGDLVSFAENEFRATKNVTLFDDMDDEMAEYVQNQIQDADFIQKVKKLLHEEVIKNWTKLLDETRSPVVQNRRTEFIQKISDSNIFYFVDSKYPKRYDTMVMFRDVKALMDARSPKGPIGCIGDACDL